MHTKPYMYMNAKFLRAFLLNFVAVCRFLSIMQEFVIVVDPYGGNGWLLDELKGDPGSSHPVYAYTAKESHARLVVRYGSLCCFSHTSASVYSVRHPDCFDPTQVKGWLTPRYDRWNHEIHPKFSVKRAILELLQTTSPEQTVGHLQERVGELSKIVITPITDTCLVTTAGLELWARFHREICPVQHWFSQHDANVYYVHDGGKRVKQHYACICEKHFHGILQHHKCPSASLCEHIQGFAEHLEHLRNSGVYLRASTNTQ